MPPTPTRLVGPDWVSARLNCSGRMVRGLAKAGAIRAYKIGLRRGRYRFDPADVERYLERQATRPKGEEVALG